MDTACMSVAESLAQVISRDPDAYFRSLTADQAGSDGGCVLALLIRMTFCPSLVSAVELVAASHPEIWGILGTWECIIPLETYKKHYATIKAQKHGHFLIDAMTEKYPDELAQFYSQ